VWLQAFVSDCCDSERWANGGVCEKGEGERQSGSESDYGTVGGRKSVK